jgi:hypothetical protein
VFKLKRDEAGTIVMHKAHLVACGFVQREGIDFDDTFAPWHGWNLCDSSLRWLPRGGWRVHHMDVKSAFLNDNLKEEVYVISHRDS